MGALILTGGTVVEMNPARVQARDLVVSGDRIVDADSAIPTTTVVDVSHCLVLPGFVVGHTHLYSGLAAGMPVPGEPPQDFLQILERVWWNLDQALDEETLEASATVAAIAALKAGATTIFDHHESPRFIDGSLDVIARALEEIGLRGVLAYGATDRHGPDGARQGIAESARFMRARADDSKVRGAIGLHAPFTCSDGTLAAAGAEMGTKGWLHLHAAEGPNDQMAAQARWNDRLFHHLDSIGLLTERTIVAHAVDADPSEAQRLKDRRTWVTHQARSNMNNGVGYAGALRKLDRVALGTDGIDNDMLAELKAAFFRGRESTGPSEWPDPVAMLARGHTMASEIFGQPIGSLAPGAPADLTVLAYDPSTPLNESTLGSHLLFGASSLHVRDVFVAGRAVLRNRRLVGIDEHEVQARARAAAERLWSRL